MLELMILSFTVLSNTVDREIVRLSKSASVLFTFRTKDRLMLELMMFEFCVMLDLLIVEVFIALNSSTTMNKVLL